MSDEQHQKQDERRVLIEEEHAKVAAMKAALEKDKALLMENMDKVLHHKEASKEELQQVQQDMEKAEALKAALLTSLDQQKQLARHLPPHNSSGPGAHNFNNDEAVMMDINDGGADGGGDVAMMKDMENFRRAEAEFAKAGKAEMLKLESQLRARQSEQQKQQQSANQDGVTKSDEPQTTTLEDD